jgi:SAM-dependent methyltransferase
MTTTNDQVKEYYDQFKEHQTKLGINIRHRTIFKNLKKAGLRKDSKVLEIGCGIGTVSHLILKYIKDGSFVGLDISPESIKAAQKFNAFHPKAEFLVNDMSNFSHSTKFDFIVFPDVLEHIPVSQHAHIFKTVSELSAPDAVILINIPEPNFLDWMRIHQPQNLQIIDQALSMQDLLNNSYPYGFKLYSMNPYHLHYDHPDYLCIILKKNMGVDNISLRPYLKRGVESFMSKI